MTIITSQHFIDEEIVAEKIANGDFEVFVSPAFEVNGETYRVLLDGHHSLAAAIEAGREPTITERNEADDDRVALIGNPEDFLAACWMDGEYIDAATKEAIW